MLRYAMALRVGHSRPSVLAACCAQNNIAAHDVQLMAPTLLQGFQSTLFAVERNVHDEQNNEIAKKE